MKNTVKPEAVKFNIAYTDIAAGAKLVHEQLKQNISFAKKLGKKAQKLYHYGNSKCYNVYKGGIHPIDGIKNLDYKMDLLDQLANLYTELKDLTEQFDMEVK